MKARFNPRNVVVFGLIGAGFLTITMIFISDPFWFPIFIGAASGGIIGSLIGLYKILTNHAGRYIYDIESAEDIKIEKGALLIRAKRYRHRIDTHVVKSTLSKFKRTGIKKYHIHPDDWEKFVNWLKELKQRQMVKHEKITK